MKYMVFCRLLVYNGNIILTMGDTILIKVYHGTNLSSAFDIWLHGIDLNKSLPNLDFGKGFYVTNNKRKAIERALKKTSDYNNRYKCEEDPYLVEMYIDESNFSKLNTKIFTPREREWFEFVVNNRLDIDYLKRNAMVNHNKDNKYDIVYGEIADGKIADIVNNIKNNSCNIHGIDYLHILPETGKFYGNQYSFHTEKSLSCIRDISCVTIKPHKKERRWN